VIDAIRNVSNYKGKLVYSANWANLTLDSGGDEALAPFWDKLDYLGVDAYYFAMAGITNEPDNI
jgi:hypothetical protein